MMHSIKKILEGMPLPPEGSGAVVHSSVLYDSQGLCLGGALVWAYGPVSAFLTAERLADARYEDLPDAAQELLDYGECLMNAALTEVHKARRPGSPS